MAFAITKTLRHGTAPIVLTTPSGTATLAKGAAVPTNFTLAKLGARGSTAVGGAIDGHPAVVNFFASWCTICQAEMTTLATNARSFGDGVRFVGIDTDDAAPSTAVDIAHRADVAYRLLRDSSSGAMAAAYGANFLPMTFIVNAKGRLVQVIRGQVTTAQLHSALDPLLAMPK